MPISRDWNIEINQASFMQKYGHTFTRVLRRPGMAEAFDETFCEAAGLVEPVVAWDRFPVREMRHEKVILTDGRRIGNGPVTTVMGGAEQVAIGVCTIGPRLPERVREHKDAGDAMRSMLLDQLGTLAVAQLSQLFYQQLREDARSQGWQISTYLSPGESEWSVRDQAVIFDLVDAAQIGVSLTETMT